VVSPCHLAICRELSNPQSFRNGYNSGVEQYLYRMLAEHDILSQPIIQASGYCPEYDGIHLTERGNILPTELKIQSLPLTSIEVNNSRGMPSGISVTRAIFWITINVKDTKTGSVRITKTEDIRQHIRVRDLSPIEYDNGGSCYQIPLIHVPGSVEVGIVNRVPGGYDLSTFRDGIRKLIPTTSKTQTHQHSEHLLQFLDIE
jgi:hypothetical protein